MSNDTKFKASLVVDYEFTEQEAAHILSDPKPALALNAWLSTHGAAEESACGYNSEKLHAAFGVHLASKKVAECKQLPLSTGESEPTMQDPEPSIAHASQDF